MYEELGSGRRVAMETLLLGLKRCRKEELAGAAPTAAIEIRLGWIRLLLFDPAAILVKFSLPSAACDEAIDGISFRSRGDGGGNILVILRSGILGFGARGGFFSVIIFCTACF